MAGNERDDELLYGGSTGSSTPDGPDRRTPRRVSSPQWVESFDALRNQVSALLDSWASAEIDALMRDLEAMLDHGGTHCPCGGVGCPRA